MFIQLRPAVLEVVAGSTTEVEITVIDPPGGLSERLEVMLAGIEPEWVTRVDTAPDDMVLAVGDGRLTARLAVSVPADHPAGERLLAVGVRPESDRRGAAFERLPMSVVDRVPIRVSTDPSIATGGRPAVRLVIANDADREIVVAPLGEDDEGTTEFRYERSRVEVPGGTHRSVGLQIAGGRHLVGAARRRTVRVGVDAGHRVLVDLPVVQRPVFPTWSLIAVALVLGLVSVVLLGNTGLFDGDAGTDDGGSELDGIDDGAGAVVAELALPGGAITGTVRDDVLDEPVAGALVELFAVDDPVDPVTTAATDADGAYRLGGVPPGDYTMRVSATGFDPAWLGDVERFTEAAALTVAADAAGPVPADVVVLTGESGSIAGRLSGADLGGLVVSVTPVGESTPLASTVVEAGAGGAFTLAPLPTPGRYTVTVSAPGGVTGAAGGTLVSHVVDLAAGEDDASLVLVVPSGPGAVTGVVVTGAGPLGGATVDVSDGRATIRTISLTQGVIGRFAVDGLAVPGRYTLTVTRAGFAQQSLAVDLSEASPVAEVEVPLAAAAGTVTGRIVGPGGIGLGGVEVRATSDGVDVVSASIDAVGISAGADPAAAGTFTVVGLPVPGTYTLTFVADGRRTVTREVRLTTDARPGALTVTMIPEAVGVSGTVTGLDGVGLARVTIVLSDGVRVRTSVSADEPLGRFEFSDIAPGSYTLTARRPGADPVVVLVTVPGGVADGSGLDLEVPVAVGPAAVVTGRVVTVGSSPLSGAVVRLFRLADYPGAASAAVASTVTDADGRFTLSGFEAPADHIVAVYPSATATSAAVTASTRPAVATATDVGELLVP